MRTLADCTAHDVDLTDQAQYAAHVARWQTELHPNGELECWFAAEIVRATWRLERYAALDKPEMTDDSRAKWLNYRNQTTLSLRRNLEELRRIQSDRYLQSHLGILLPGIASLKLILPGLKRAQFQAESTPEPDAKPAPAEPALIEVQASEAVLHAKIQEEERRQIAEHRRSRPESTHGSIPDSTPETAPAAPAPKPAAPRNALCPCNSGQKFKRCCGHWSKSPLPKAA